MKFWGWILRIVVVALGICLFMLQSQYAKKTILEFILNQPVKNSSYHVEVNGIHGLFPFRIEVASLELKSKDTSIAALHDVVATWSVPSLLMMDIKVDVNMKNQLFGDVIYHIDKHALLVKLVGNGYNIWHQEALKSLVVDLPELKLVRGQVTAQLEHQKIPITVTVQLEEVDDDLLLVKDINIAGQDLQGKGHCGIYPKQDAWEGDLSLTLQNLHAYYGHIDETIAGSATLTCTKKLKQPLNLAIHLDQFHYDHSAAQSINIQAKMEYAKKEWNLVGQGVMVNNIALTQVIANGWFDDKQGDFNCTGKGPHNIALNVQGEFQLPAQETSLKEMTITRAELIHPQHQLSLRKSVSIKWNGKFFHMPMLLLASRTGTLTVQDFLINNTLLSGNLTIDRFPLTILSIIYPNWPLSGFVSGKGKLQGSLEQPDGELSLEAKNLQLSNLTPSRGKTAPLDLNTDLSTTFKLSKGLLAWQAKLASRKMVSLVSQGKLSVHPWLPTETSTIEGEIKGQGDMGIISTLLQNGDLIQGQLLMDLTMKGTVTNPAVNGHFSIANGLYENATFGTLIRNIKISGNANNQAINISTITGRDNAKGHVSGQGSLKFATSLNPELDIKLKLDNFIFAQNDEVSGKATGSLNLQGALFSEAPKNIAITGDLKIHPIEIHLEDHTEKLVTIQLLEKKRDGSYQTSKEKHHQVDVERSSIPIPLDIKLTSPGEIYVRGYGFDARWKGDVRAKGTLFDPYLVGDIILERGKFDLVGKPLKLTEGKITYSEGHKNDPLMAIVGTREVGDITATMRIDGYASNPKITFSSSPALPQEEVLARLLFGRGVESMSVTQSLLLANALSTFKGKNNLNFTEKFRSAFGLDVLEFKERKSADGDDLKAPSQQVSVGKQLTDNIYLSVDQSVSGDSGTSATVQYDVTPSFKLEADVGGESNAGIGFSWVKKY